ncbi:SRPBCC family protein [Nonomuraea sp. NPDC050556]|uniref:SRPBCC family protein n=1 Tax=Nonomuraea sp. NPDC050556 TaxID=3364369 RepID=UPI0037BD98EC
MAMRFEHEFSVPVPVEQAWAALLDVERVAPCLPGATLDIVEGDEFTGRMKVKVGPITVTYRGTAGFEDVDKDTYSLKLKASGREARGSGTAEATVAAALAAEDDGGTRVRVETTFNVTGRPAQFGRGVMFEVGGKLIDRFAVNLAELLAEEPQETERHLAAVPEPAADNHPVGTLRTSRTPDEEALDLMEIAGAPILKRAAPIVGALALLALLVWVIRRMLR